MTCEIVAIRGTWRDVADAARATVGKEAGEGEPSIIWKRRMIHAEHSPIRLIHVTAEFRDLPSWVSVHLTRHKIGIEHFVRSQRTDRTGVPRDKLPQDAPVVHRIEANLQAIVTVSRKRLCNQASPETRGAWNALVAAVEAAMPEMAGLLVPECVYRGFCPEMKPCGYQGSQGYLDALAVYRSGPPAVDPDLIPPGEKTYVVEVPHNLLRPDSFQALVQDAETRIMRTYAAESMEPVDPGAITAHPGREHAELTVYHGEKLVFRRVSIADFQGAKIVYALAWRAEGPGPA